MTINQLNHYMEEDFKENGREILPYAEEKFCGEFQSL
jgi:hypothetical protein